MKQNRRGLYSCCTLEPALHYLFNVVVVVVVVGLFGRHFMIYVCCVRCD